MELEEQQLIPLRASHSYEPLQALDLRDALDEEIPILVVMTTLPARNHLFEVCVIKPGAGLSGLHSGDEVSA